MFAMNCRRRYFIFVCFIYGLEEKNSKSEVIFAVNVMLKLSYDAIYQTPKTVFDHRAFPYTEKRVENTTRRGLFWMNFQVFGNAVKHYIECLNIFSINTKTKEKTLK